MERHPEAGADVEEELFFSDDMREMDNEELEGGKGV
jgi:hypothetical protein